MDKQIVKPLVECVSSLTEKQSLILQLLSQELNLPDEAKKKLLTSSQENDKQAKILRQSLEDYL